MTQQEILNENTTDLKKLIDIRNKEMMELENFFKEKGVKTSEDINELIQNEGMSDVDMDTYFRVSQLSLDVNTLSKKVCDFIYFSKLLSLELDTEVLQEIPNFPLFVKDYQPYKTAFTINSENKTEETNKKEYNESKASFKKVMNNKSIIQLIKENEA